MQIRSLVPATPALIFSDLNEGDVFRTPNYPGEIFIKIIDIDDPTDDECPDQPWNATQVSDGDVFGFAWDETVFAVFGEFVETTNLI